MIKTFHEAPKCIFNAVQGMTDGDYALVNLFAEDEEYRGYVKGQVIKYITRERHKNGLEDLKKAAWYLNRLIKRLEKQQR